MRWEYHTGDDENATTIKTLYKFKQVDSNPSFNNWATFVPEFPDDYIVDELYGDGFGKIIHNPGGDEIRNLKKELNNDKE